MKLVTPNIVVRDFERKDADNLYQIVRDAGILRFMPDWAHGVKSPQDYFEYID